MTMVVHFYFVYIVVTLLPLVTNQSDLKESLWPRPAEKSWTEDGVEGLLQFIPFWYPCDQPDKGICVNVVFVTSQKRGIYKSQAFTNLVLSCGGWKSPVSLTLQISY